MNTLTSTMQSRIKPHALTAAKVFLVALAYFVSGRLGLELAYLNSHITLIWLPTGIAVAALLRWGYICWIGIFIGAFATNYSIDTRPLLDFSLATGNTLGPLLAVWLLNRLRFQPRLNRVIDIANLIFAAAIGMLITSSGGVISLMSFGVISVRDAGSAWLSWWAGDFVGVLLFVPLLLNLSRTARRPRINYWWEILLWCLISGALSWWLFTSSSRTQFGSSTYLLLPLMVWSALRFQIAVSSGLLLLPLFMASWGTANGLGTFHSNGELQDVLTLWLFYFTLVALNLMVRAMQAERFEYETKLERITLLYSALSECRLSILRCTAETDLFQQICRHAVEIGGLPMAWVGLVDESTHLVKPVAQYGSGTDYLHDIRISVDAGEPYGGGTTGTAIRENCAVWIQDFLHDRRLAPWHERAAGYGWSGVAALPLHRNGKAVGALMLYAGVTNAFDEATRKLLIGMAIDIDAAMDKLVARAQRQAAEDSLRESEARTQLFLDTAMDAVISSDQEGRVIGWNREAAHMFGYASEQVLGKDLAELIVPPKYRTAHRNGMRRFIRTGKGTLPGQRMEMMGMRAGGKEFPVELTLVGVQRQGRYFFNAFIRDITARKADEVKLQRIVSMHAALSLCNQTILRCDTEPELLQAVCRDVVNLGGMKMAWIGLVDNATQLVQPEASYGVGTEYLDDLKISTDANDPSGCGPTGIVMREALPCWCQDYLNEAGLALWRERGLQLGWAASASLPLYRDGRIIGTLNVYAGELHAFDETVKSLLLSMATDISFALTRLSLLEERKQSEEAMRIAAVTFETQEAIMITDADNKILRVNRAFEILTGYTASEVIGADPRILKSGKQDAAFYQSMWSELVGQGKWSGEIWDKRKNGEIYPKLLNITAVYDDSHKVVNYVSVARDISRRKKSEHEIHQLAFYDELTKLPNRRLLTDRLQQATTLSARQDKYSALIFLDLDNFKNINDTQGHATGDLLLAEAARRLTLCVRDSDTVARLGGDEFVVVLEGLNKTLDEAATLAEQVAEKIKSELGNAYELNHFECICTPSIGIVLFKGQQQSINDLLKHADAAMYQAKAAGRNTVRFYDPAMQRTLEARITLTGELQKALQRRQFRLYYQAQVDRKLRTLGAEVLLRWEHPDQGMISPMQFIPLAEDTGLIIPIGLWVLQTACEQLRAWESEAPMRDLTLAVNVSAKQFRQNDFVAQVQRVLRESGASPRKLKLELTESTILDNFDDTIAKMHELKIMGIDFSLDDFGTGYSSLQYLKRLPLNQIKIDQTFVRDIASDPNDAAIVKAIIAMTEALGLDVIAEGVETQAQREFLDKNGCHNFQGYLFGKPVPLDAFKALFQDR